MNESYEEYIFVHLSRIEALEDAAEELSEALRTPQFTDEPDVTAINVADVLIKTRDIRKKLDAIDAQVISKFRNI
jgi:hypothetical protein